MSKTLWRSFRLHRFTAAKTLSASTQPFGGRTSANRQGRICWWIPFNMPSEVSVCFITYFSSVVHLDNIKIVQGWIIATKVCLKMANNCSLSAFACTPTRHTSPLTGRSAARGYTKPLTILSSRSTMTKSTERITLHSLILSVANDHLHLAKTSSHTFTYFRIRMWAVWWTLSCTSRAAYEYLSKLLGLADAHLKHI